MQSGGVDNISEKGKIMKRNQSMVRRVRSESNSGTWSIVGGVTLLALAAAVVVSLPDIKRYLKIRAM